MKPDNVMFEDRQITVSVSVCLVVMQSYSFYKTVLEVCYPYFTHVEVFYVSTIRFLWLIPSCHQWPFLRIALRSSHKASLKCDGRLKIVKFYLCFKKCVFIENR
jgi:hypothetical protein